MWLCRLQCVRRGSSGLRILVCPSLLGSQACVYNCTMGAYPYLGEFGHQGAWRGVSLKAEGVEEAGLGL